MVLIAYYYTLLLPTIAFAVLFLSFQLTLQLTLFGPSYRMKNKNYSRGTFKYLLASEPHYRNVMLTSRILSMGYTNHRMMTLFDHHHFSLYEFLLSTSSPEYITDRLRNLGRNNIAKFVNHCKNGRECLDIK